MGHSIYGWCDNHDIMTNTCIRRTKLSCKAGQATRLPIHWMTHIAHAHWFFFVFFIARHHMALCCSVFLSVCLSVCLSHWWVTPNTARCRNVLHFLYYRVTPVIRDVTFHSREFEGSHRTSLKTATHAPCQQRIFAQYCAITRTRCEIGRSLVLFTVLGSRIYELPTSIEFSVLNDF